MLVSSVAIVSVVWFTSTFWRRDQVSAPYTPPTPAGPASRRRVVDSRQQPEQVSRVATHRVRTCGAHYPGEQNDRQMSVYPVALSGLRLVTGDSALASHL